MGANTPLWISAWGSCSDVAVIGVLVTSERVVLLTKVAE
jgi:hypothetical protein